MPIKWSATENIAWKTPLAFEGWSSPIVYGDRIFVTGTTAGGSRCHVVALDRKTGTLVWNKEVLTQQTRRKEPKNSYATPTAVTDGNHVFAVFGGGGMVAVDNQGNISWTYDEVKFYSRHGLGMNVSFFDPYIRDGVDKALGVRRVDALDELLRQSHVLSLHCPLTEETRHIIDAAAIARLPRGAFLVNTARGAVVDTGAIAPAIAGGQLAGAAIDVLPCEPPADDDPLLIAWRDPSHPAHDRLIVNPHGAFYCVEGLLDMRLKGAEACKRAVLGLPLRNVVN